MLCPPQFLNIMPTIFAINFLTFRISIFTFHILNTSQGKLNVKCVSVRLGNVIGQDMWELESICWGAVVEKLMVLWGEVEDETQGRAKLTTPDVHHPIMSAVPSISLPLFLTCWCLWMINFFYISFAWKIRPSDLFGYLLYNIFDSSTCFHATHIIVPLRARLCTSLKSWRSKTAFCDRSFSIFSMYYTYTNCI